MKIDKKLLEINPDKKYNCRNKAMAIFNIYLNDIANSANISDCVSFVN